MTDGRTIILMLLSGAAGCAATLASLQFSSEPSATVATAIVAPEQETSAKSTQSRSEVSREAIIRRDADGHYWSRADVDGTEVKFMVDTGASTVALTYRDAQRLGLEPENLDFNWRISTAGGETKGASVLLNFIRIGNVEVHNVEAMVLGEELEQSLLGMSFLGELYSYEFQRRNLVIRQ